MAMTVTDHDNDELMSEINMIPLIDVMLVLLIVFIITIPVIKHAVQVNLPQASAERSTVTRARFDDAAAEPPRRITALPVFRHRLATSMVTFGRAS